MGVVKDHLHGLIERQVLERGVVVWSDPEGDYAAFVQNLALSDTRIEVFDGSFFALRHRVDSLLAISADVPPKLLVYLPKRLEETADALIELTSAGVVMQPGRSSPLLNTRLAVVAKAALRPILGKDELARIEKQIDDNKLTLDDLDMLGEQEGAAGVISVLFATTNPRDVALVFLAGGRVDKEIDKRQAVAEVAAFLGRAFGVEPVANGGCMEVRASLARHLLVTEFVASIHGPLPASLGSAKIASTRASLEACMDLVRVWRNRRDLTESYAEHADRVEQELRLSSLGLTLDQLRDCETFAGLDTLLQSAVEDRALTIEQWTADEHAALRTTVARRLLGFWAVWPERYPAIQPRWQLDQVAVDLLATASRIERDLKSLPSTPEVILQRYATGLDREDPWCLLDTYHRHLERRVESVDAGPGWESLARLLALARQRYRAVGEMLSERFLRLCQAADFRLPGLHKQTEIYSTWVAPALRQGKTAYLLVDALRFEMARELAQGMPGDYDVSLDLALGTVPTITPVGMAACLPSAGIGSRVVQTGAGNLAFEIDGTIIKTREDRVRWLMDHTTPTQTGEPATSMETKLEPLVRSTRAPAGSKQADLILVTSQEIDEIAETDNIGLARRTMDDTLAQLQRAVRKLADLGCSTIVVTADHGHLFGDELDSDTKIDPPGGETVYLQRRIWVGNGGASGDAYLRTSLAELGVGEDLEVAVPWGFGGFKVAGGARAYFHGGMSPQEIAVPILVVRAKVTRSSASEIEWELMLGSRKITTRFVSVRVSGTAAGQFFPALPRTRVEIRIDGQPVSEPVSATYGFNEGTRDIELALDDDGRTVQDNTVTIMITSGRARGTASVHLLDSTTGLELTRLDDVGVDIAL